MRGVDVEALSRRYGPMVLRRCRRLLGDEDEALDACQDVFLRVLQHWARLDDRYPAGLLYRIATNVCLNRLRDNRRNPVTRDEAFLYEIARAEEPGAARVRRGCCWPGCSDVIPNRAARSPCCISWTV